MDIQFTRCLVLSISLFLLSGFTLVLGLELDPGRWEFFSESQKNEILSTFIIAAVSSFAIPFSWLYLSKHMNEGWVRVLMLLSGIGGAVGALVLMSEGGTAGAGVRIVLGGLVGAALVLATAAVSAATLMWIRAGFSSGK